MVEPQTGTLSYAPLEKELGKLSALEIQQLFLRKPKEHYLGNKKKVCIGIEIQDAISRTGNSPSEKGPDVWLDPETWQAFAEYAKNRLADTLAKFNLRHREQDTEEEQAATTKYHAQWVAEDAELLETILRKIKSWEKDTPRMKALHEKNTTWAREDQILHTIEQPYEVQNNGATWFIQTCITGGGAVGGAHVPIKEVNRQLTEKIGAGELVEIDKKWFWKTPRKPLKMAK